MATLPPRKFSNFAPTDIAKEHLTPLQILLQLGFPEHRATKALAATGHRSLQLASDWLLAHVTDPTLDEKEPREYVLYLCPTGQLHEQLQKFWFKSRELEWNGAHNFMPHITLVPPFKVTDELSKQAADILETLTAKDDCPDAIELETYVSPNFMGLFVKDEQAKWLKSLAAQYVGKLLDVGITAEPNTKSLHLTLAYQFSDSLFEPLSTMVEKLTTTGVVGWELRLYSKDPRSCDLHVHKVMHAHVPRNHDELELRPGDYIYVPEEACASTIDGWVEGVSWLTGLTGYFPLNHTKRTAESDAWTLHSTVQILDNKVECRDNIIPKARKPPVILFDDSIDAPDGVAEDSEPLEGEVAAATGSREILICRHGERVDFTFGTWIPYCFEADGCYVRRDLNMPIKIPPRNIKDFQDDCPLTALGELQASLIGEAMKESNVRIDVAFASPSLRCIQTLSQILKGFESDLSIKVEPGLMEWVAWYQNGLPTWMTSEELSKAGFNVDSSYKPIVKADELPLRESAAQYYARSYALIKSIIENTKGNILIVAHAISLAACTRQLIGGQVPQIPEVTRLVQQVPYLACLMVKEGPNGWVLLPPPFPPITHSSNKRFDWKILT
ncbi:protein UBASH3A homolog [Copidosoma floridanum]|uniref:protein UBASH3A homolog n=1 Tax=Copidosoma floridanum TaxID=29053 RepID=UPI0006C96C75|nr:protein UBASH3A homolog [Copidosoma floridanum]